MPEEGIIRPPRFGFHRHFTTSQVEQEPQRGQALLSLRALRALNLFTSAPLIRDN